MSEISQLLRIRFWPNFEGRFLRPSLTGFNCLRDNCPCNICPVFKLKKIVDFFLFLGHFFWEGGCSLTQCQNLVKTRRRVSILLAKAESTFYFDSSSLSFSAKFFKLQQKTLYYKNGWPQSLFWMRRDEMIIKSSLDGKGGKTSSARSATLEDTSWARLTTELMRGLRISWGGHRRFQFWPSGRMFKLRQEQCTKF